MTNKDLLGKELKKKGCNVFFDQGDADVQIVSKTLELAEEKNTVLVGDDTDLLVLLLHHCKSKKKIYFAPEQKKNSKNRVWDIKQVKSDLGTFLCQYFLLMPSYTVTPLQVFLFRQGNNFEKTERECSIAASSSCL